MSDSPIRKEKRKHQRFSVSQMIEMSFPRETFFHAEGINISEGGMLCRSSYTVEPLTKVYFMLQIPAGEEGHLIKAEGTVIHTRKEGDQTIFGVSFDGFSRSNKEVLHLYLDSLDEG